VRRISLGGGSVAKYLSVQETRRLELLMHYTRARSEKPAAFLPSFPFSPRNTTHTHHLRWRRG
jgi:hypothetical protein